MKMIPIKSILLVTLIVLLEVPYIYSGEPKTLVEDILTNPENHWKDLHLLPSQLIGSMILHNHPIVTFILNETIMATVLKDHKDHARYAKFNSSGDRVLATYCDETVRLWETRSGNCLHTFKAPSSFFSRSYVKYSWEDMVITSQDGEAKIWEISSGTCLQTLKGHTRYLHSARFSRLGDRVLTVYRNGTVKLWETRSGKCLQTLGGPSGTPCKARFNGPGDRVITFSKDNTVILWDTKSGKCLLQTFQSIHLDLGLLESSFDSSGDLVLTFYENTVKLWETKRGTCIQTLKHGEEILSAVFNGSGDRVLTVSGSFFPPKPNTVNLWDTTSGECLHTLTEHRGLSFFPEFSGPGNMILTHCHGIARLWDTTSGEYLHTLEGIGFPESSFTSSGDMVLTRNLHKNTLKLWQTLSGTCLLTLAGHTLDIKHAGFNASGDAILVGTGHSYYDDTHVTLFNISLFLKLRSFFLRDDSISLNQALVLIGIYEIIIFRKLLRKGESSNMPYYRKITNMFKKFSTSTEEHTKRSDCVVFDFRKCPHLQTDYEKLPQEIQRILDEYVRKVSSENDCSTASTTDDSDFASTSTSMKS